MDRIISYAQNREDIILSAFFKDYKTGFYVDVGANEPEFDSVTKYFYERGWHGINIEPSLPLYKKLVAERPRDINLNIGVSDKEGTLDFREYEGSGLSTFSSDTKTELEDTKHPFAQKYKDYTVKVDTLSRVFEKNKVSEIDFMKIDVEGYEYEVILGNDWKKYRPKVLCIKSNHIHADWYKILINEKYERVFHDGINDYFVDTTKLSKDDFNYIEMVIGRRIISNFFSKQLIDANNEVADFKMKNSILKDEVLWVQAQNNQLRELIQQNSRIRGSAKLLANSLDKAFYTQLEKLDKSSAGINKKFSALSPSKLKDLDPKEAVSVVHDWDLENLPQFQDLEFIPKRGLVYNVFDKIHKTNKKITKTVAKGGLKTANKIKRLSK